MSCHLRGSRDRDAHDPCCGPLGRNRRSASAHAGPASRPFSETMVQHVPHAASTVPDRIRPSHCSPSCELAECQGVPAGPSCELEIAASRGVQEKLNGESALSPATRSAGVPFQVLIKGRIANVPRVVTDKKTSFRGGTSTRSAWTSRTSARDPEEKSFGCESRHSTKHGVAEPYGRAVERC